MSDATIGRLQDIFSELTPEHHPTLGALTGQGGQGSTGQLPSVVNVAIEIDARIERMVRLAILSAPAVILVGPPGSGKTTLLRQVVDRIAADPQSVGFQVGPAGVEWSAAEENWSATDLVGGQTIDGGELRFRPGRVLGAVANGHWLVIDEVNRADMDRIFGGLLTWLSGQDVTLGAVSPAIGSPQVELGWSGTPTCRVDNAHLLTDPAPGQGAVRYLAGTEWRLLGTYNAVDAQRVFRFGHALGRRFLRVPIPAADVERFRTALRAKDTGLPEPLLDAIAALYEVHLANSTTTLGPALFLRIADYIAAGVGTAAEPLTGVSLVDRELLAEAYLVNVGTWLREMEDELPSMGRAIVEHHQVLSQSEWQWVVEMSRILS